LSDTNTDRRACRPLPAFDGDDAQPMVTRLVCVTEHNLAHEMVVLQAFGAGCLGHGFGPRGESPRLL
jgi:hypothetical protein